MTPDAESSGGEGSRLAAAVARETRRRRRVLWGFLVMLAVPIGAMVWIVASPAPKATPSPPLQSIGVAPEQVAELQAQLVRNDARLGVVEKRVESQTPLAPKPADTQPDTVGRQVNEQQQLIRELENRMAMVDQKATAADARAQEAQQRAASLANQLNASLQQLSARSAGNGEVVIEEGFTEYRGEQTAVPEAAARSLDAIMSKLKQEPRNVTFEIVAYVGADVPPADRARIGTQRAEAIRRYLYEQHGVALARISTLFVDSSARPTDNRVLFRVRS